VGKAFWYSFLVLLMLQLQYTILLVCCLLYLGVWNSQTTLHMVMTRCWLCYRWISDSGYWWLLCWRSRWLG